MTLSNIYYLHEIGGKKNQEDYIWPVPGIATLQDNFFIVCDGVGGSENGEIASRIIAESVGNDLLKNKDKEITQSFISKLIKDAIDKLKAYATKQGLATDMATTFSLLAFHGEKAFIAWCGDSRVYHLRKGETIYKTADHSLVASLVKSGEISEEEAQSHPQKNIILKAIRIDAEPAEIEYHIIEDIEAGDYFMLCTDGVLENIAESDLKFLTNKNDTGEIDMVKSFQQFCFGKTKDNYSMYMLRVGGDSTDGNRQKKKNNALMMAGILLIALISAGAYFVNNKNLHRNVNAGSTTILDSVSTANIHPDSAISDSIIQSQPPDSTEPVVITKTVSHDDKAVPIPVNQKNAKDSLANIKKTVRKTNDSINALSRKKPMSTDSLATEKKDTTSSEPH